MGYLSKELIIKAYHELANLAEGAERTTSTSALRYTLAIDAFYHKYNRDCDGKNKDDKKLFIEIVRSFVQLTDNDYVVNFFDDIKRKSDCGVGSNLFGGPLFLKSKANPEEEYACPQNKKAKLYDVKNCVFKKNESYYSNIGNYLSLDSLKCALIIWLLRSCSLDSLNYLCIKQKLLEVFSEALVDSILPLEDILCSYIENCSLEDNMATIEKNDLLGTTNKEHAMFFQQIFYGAPGTGKSNEIKNLTGENGNDRMFEKDCTFRTTFHPDTDYASFVGAYKPITKKNKTKILDIERLSKELGEQVSVDDRGSFAAFGAKYYASFLGQDFDYKKLLCVDNDFDEAYAEYINIGVKIGKSLPPTESKIVYEFRPQSFLKAYIKAWKNPSKNVALVVEEINRGNCAQIFGDIFQLLDREKNGLSKYPIECDVEMQELLAEEFGKESKEYGPVISDVFNASDKECIINYYSAHYDNAFDKIKNGEILALPMNLSILATMNTSDQSLFPMDSAFKRRWDWIYEPIVEGKKEDGTSLGWKVEIDDTHSVDWWKFLQKINAVIYSLTSSEDKQLGYFFCQPEKEDNVTISKNLFIGKVIFYLWNEIFKDYAFEHDVCKKENKSDTLYFADFYDGKNVIKQTALVTFFKHLDENQPKIDGKDVKLIEEITNGSPATDIPLDAENKGDETLADVNSEQSEETATENTEA